MDRSGISVNAPPVFDGTNYSWWKIAMRAFLQSRDFQSWVLVVNGYVAPVVAEGEGTVPKDIGLYTPAEILSAKQNSEGLNAIIHAIAPSLHHHVSTCATSKQAWDILESVFEGNSSEKEARLQNLCSEWEKLRMADEETFDDFHHKVSEIVNASFALGKVIPEKEIVMKILRSLPSRYDSKKHAIVEGNNLNDLSRSALVGKLKIFDQEHASAVGKDVAFRAQKNTKVLSRSKSVHVSDDDHTDDDFSEEDIDKSVSLITRQFRDLLLKRNKRFSRDKAKPSDKPHGRVPPKNRDADEADDDDMPQCFKCKGFGHFANECPNRRKYTGHKGLAVTLDEMSDRYDSEEDKKSSVGLHCENVDFDACSNTFIDLEGFAREEVPIKLEDVLGNPNCDVSGSTICLAAVAPQMPDFHSRTTCSYCSMKGHELSRCYKYKHQVRHANKLQRRADHLARRLMLAQKTAEVCKILSSHKKLVSKVRPSEKKPWSSRFDRQKPVTSSSEDKGGQIVVHHSAN